MRPVTVEHVVSQYFASMPTAGVAANSDPASGVGYYVYLYGDYQPFGHAGMDFACPVGTPVHAIADGVVLYAGWGYDLPGTGPIRKWLFYKDFPGILTVIQHDGWISASAHQSDNDAVSAGQHVRAGQQIGLSGDTGGVAPHLHVEALVDLSYTTGGGLIYGRTDPSKFFSGGIAAQGTITTTPTEQDWLDMASLEDVEAASYRGTLKALGWAIDTDDGKKLSVFGMVGSVLPLLAKMPDRILDTETPRAGEFGGNTSLRGVLAYADQKHIEALRATATAAHGDGVSADQIIQAVRDALAAGVKVEASVTVGK